MLTTSTKVSPDANVVFTEMENGESVLLHLGTNEYFSLNETGTLIWKGISDERNLGEIGKELEKTFDVTKEQATQSVMRLVESLVAQKLVSVKSG
jgi:sensor domain CHASE-containing protein